MNFLDGEPTKFPHNFVSTSEKELPFKMGICDDPMQIKMKYPLTRGKLWFILIRKKEYPDFMFDEWGQYIGNYTLPRTIGECNGIGEHPKIDITFVYQKDNFSYIGYPKPFSIDFSPAKN